MNSVRHPSALAALPPPSRLLLPRVRTASCIHPLSLRSSHDSALQWLGLPLAFDVVQDQLEIDGYQMYAVEKWIVERNRPITVLTVYTGDPSHKITVTALAPSSTLSEKDAVQHWEQALLHLRRDASARPKQTSAGVLMATSLAYFRSDYTIVHIPHGNFLLAKNQLYTNINLLRMGCGGRSALTLEEPSDSTKDRFISTYHLPEITLPSSLPLPLHHHPHPTSSDHLPLSPSQPISPSSSLASRDVHPASPSRRPSHRRSQSQSSQRGSLSKSGASRLAMTPGSSTLALLGTHTKGKTKDHSSFNATVLELVKLIQIALSLFGMYDVREGHTGSLLFDGLLCDVTLRGIERWIVEIGEPRAGLEAAERIADPMFVSALLSLVLSIRNKLSAVGYSNTVPKDPFLHPHAFALVLSSYLTATSSLSSHTTLPSLQPTTSGHAGSGHHHLPIPPLPSTVTTAPYAATTFLNPTFSPPSMTPNPSNPGSANTTQLHLAGVPALLTRDIVDSIESAYAKRVASMNETDSVSLSGHTLGSGMGGSNFTGNSGPTMLRDTSTHHSATGSGIPRSQAGRRVKRVIKGKLEDFTSAVATATSNSADHHYDGGEPVDRERDERGGGALSGGEADGNMSVGSSGGQLFRGVGNLILSGASGITGTAHNSSGGGPGCIWDVNVDLEQFVKSVTDTSTNSRKLGVRSRRKKGSGKGSESVDFGRGLPSGFTSRSHMEGSIHYPTGIPQSVVNGEHGVVVTMLWSGRVADVVALREWEKERERIDGLGLSGPSHHHGPGPSIVVSDGEEARSEGLGGRSTEGEDSDLQMEARLGSASFGGVWSERVQRKIGNWTGLSKRRQPPGTEISSPNGSVGRKGGVNRFSSGNSRSPGPNRDFSGESTTNTPSKANTKVARAQSPTLYPGASFGDLLDQDDMVLESGQVSPISDHRHSPFIVEEHNLPKVTTRLYDVSQGVSTAELGRSGSSNADTGSVPLSKESNSVQQQSADMSSLHPPPLQPAFEFESSQGKGKGKTYPGLGLGRRPAYQQRISSWSDTKSAWDDEALWMGGEGKRKNKLRRANTTAMLEGTKEENEVFDDEVEEGLEEREVESDGEGDKWSKLRRLSARRRRSYHDLDSFHSMKTLSPERMKIDVELCAQVLIMVRREEHLRNVVACLESLTSTLHTTNSLLQNDYELHKDAILEIERRAQVINEIQSQVLQTNSITQEKNTLQYESAQFQISELWHTASHSRKKIFELREKVFGAGGRRLPPGKHGAHGRFNRVQWTLDGERRLVDHLGRTEEEVEEENRVHGYGYGQDLKAANVVPSPLEEEEEEVVEHAGMKPVWLLRFFTTWGARWSALRVGGGQPQPQQQNAEVVVAQPQEEATASQATVEDVKPED